MNRTAVRLAAAAMLPLSAHAQETVADPELIANMGKIEANIAEASANLYLHAMMSADAEGRDEALSEYRDDMASVENYLALIQEMDLPEEVAIEMEAFAGDWENAKALSEAMEDAHRDDLPSEDALNERAEAFEALDVHIDAALVAAGVDDTPSE